MEQKTPAVDMIDRYQEYVTLIELSFSNHPVALQEIAAAVTQFPQHAGVLVDRIDLLQPTHRLMRNEILYRSHCRELLARVVAGADTRPGTAAEVCAVCSVTSAIAPFTAAAVGLYLRMWHAAGLGQIAGVTDDLDYYEHTVGSRINELEALTRRQLTVATRRLTPAHRGGKLRQSGS